MTACVCMWKLPAYTTHKQHSFSVYPFTRSSPLPKEKIGTCQMIHTHRHTHRHRWASAEERGAVICQQGTLAAHRFHGNCLLLRTGFASQGPQIGSKASEVPPLLHPAHLRLSQLQTNCQDFLFSFRFFFLPSPCCLPSQWQNSSVSFPTQVFLLAARFVSVVWVTTAEWHKDWICAEVEKTHLICSLSLVVT